MSTLAEFARDVATDIVGLQREISRMKTMMQSGQMHMGGMRTVTIAAGVINTNQWGYYELVPQTGTTDDLDTINNGLDGKIIGIRVNDNANTITVKDGIGNICLPDGDVDLDDVCLVLPLVYDGDSSMWVLFGGAGGGGGAATFLALTDTPASYASQALKVARVNAGETAIEFLDLSTVVGSSMDIFDFLNSQKDSADTPDDDFTGGSLDGKWTVVTGSSGTVDFLETADVSKYELDTANNILLMQAGNNGSQEVSLRQDWTLGDGESIVCALGITFENVGGAATNNQLNVRMVLNDNDAGYQSGNYTWVAWDVDGNASHIQIFNGGALGDTLSELVPSGIMFFRIVREGTNYHHYYSVDGSTWNLMGTDTGGDVFDNLWINVQNGATQADPVPIITWHWVRQGNDEQFPWSPLISIPTFNGVINFGAPETLTIAGGAVTRTSTTSHFVIAAAGGGADDLDTISGGSDGDVIVISPASGDTIDVKDAVDNLQLASNFTMDNPADKMTLIYHDAISKWCEITSSGNA
jgi:hypothetical protein